MEVYADYLAQTDYEVRRVVEAFKDTDPYTNTLIILIHSDNSTSAEGTLQAGRQNVAKHQDFGMQA